MACSGCNSQRKTSLPPATTMPHAAGQPAYVSSSAVKGKLGSCVDCMLLALVLSVGGAFLFALCKYVFDFAALALALLVPTGLAFILLGSHAAAYFLRRATRAGKG